MSTPLYQQIYNSLVKDIYQGKYAVGERFPSEKEILETYAVSRITAIRALKELEAKGYIERRRGSGNKVISIFGDTPLTQSPPPKPSGAHIIGLIIPFLSYPNAQPEHFQYMQGVNDCLMQGDYRAVLYTRNDAFDERALLLRAKADGCDGLIYYPEVLAYTVDLLHNAAAEQYPIVLLDQGSPSLPLPVVGPDNRGGQKKLVEQLLQMGHRKFIYYSFDGFDAATAGLQRYVGYDEALRKANIPPDDSRVCILRSADCRGIERVDRATKAERAELQWALLKPYLDKGFTAICTVHDYEAIHLATLLQNKGVDLSRVTVTGFDGLSVVEHSSLPILTTKQNFHQIGYCAAEKLLQRLQGQSGGYEEILVPNLQ